MIASEAVHDFKGQSPVRLLSAGLIILGFGSYPKYGFYPRQTLINLFALLATIWYNNGLTDIT